METVQVPFRGDPMQIVGGGLDYSVGPVERTLPATKIVCTIGPACRSEMILASMIATGMSVARLNFSHGTQDDHREAAEAVRRAAARAGRHVALLADLQGPKIRIGDLKEPSIKLDAGDILVITTQPVTGDRDRVSTSYEALPADVAPGDAILLDDGAIRLTVLSVSGPDVTCKVENDGLLKPRKGINLPGVDLSLPALTAKDRDDLAFALELGVDAVAVSFVRRPEDMVGARALVGDAPVRLIAKIERPEALTRAEGILAASDGIMVARGDLGIEIPLEQVPREQKRLIRMAAENRKFVITATQMLESMIHAPAPTRAEVTDVANAILDGTDAIMLSGETAVGRYPVKTVATMARIAAAAEEMVTPVGAELVRETGPNLHTDQAMAVSAVMISQAVPVKGIAVFTESGHTALLISKQRPSVPVFGFTPHEHVARRLAMYRGVRPILTGPVTSTDRLFEMVSGRLKQDELADVGDRIVVTLGLPFARPGTTNLVHVLKVT